MSAGLRRGKAPARMEQILDHAGFLLLAKHSLPAAFALASPDDTFCSERQLNALIVNYNF
jgi:hypothetical protein